MPKTAFLNARIDPDLKIEAERVLAGVGVSASQAITMFYKQVVLRRGIPFDVCVPNAETVAALQEADAGGGEVFHGSVEEALEHMLNDENDDNRRG